MGGSFKQCRNKTQSSLPHHHPQREGRHRMLYFNIQRTEKYSIAMCYIFNGVRCRLKAIVKIQMHYNKFM